MPTIVAPAPLPEVVDLFIAGGISGCPDWQSEVVAELDELDIVSVNPRRADDFAKDGNKAIEQITWEHFALNRSRAVLFWFPEETLCPIALLELGSAMMRPEQYLFVGVHPNYARSLDVAHQLKLQRPEVPLHRDLDSMLEEVRTKFWPMTS